MITHSRPSSGGSFATLGGSPGDNAALAAALALKLDKAGGTMTGALAITAGALNTAALSGSQTWNNAGVTCRGIEYAVTDTNSAADSTLLRILGGAGGSTQMLSLSKGGGLTVANLFTPGLIQVTDGSTNFALLNYLGRGLDLASTRTLAWTLGSAELPPDLFLGRLAGGALRLGLSHATTPTGQTIAAHEVTTGTGASLTLQGGGGSVARGAVMLYGGNRAPYDATPSTTVIRDIMISHGLMAAS